MKEMITDSKQKRLARVMFGPVPLQGFVIRKMFEQLPEDTVIVRGVEDIRTMQWGLVMASEKFAEVPEGQIVPQFAVAVDGVKKEVEVTLPLAPENFMDELEDL